ncbi:hypothetical protein BDU57DRAFT_598109 [Ampelomyces quisqualis]|uniref:Ubiquinol-cytochrome-c reductase cytochrome c1 n=1 Tax=Ampelomyces quisqualis TaxID=50730 RepID=A0A6A5QCU7_AMPQU|nr:hypothetical protein BDU57DRAFT_598109 [Ampelomyces quisqualis]
MKSITSHFTSLEHNQDSLTSSVASLVEHKIVSTCLQHNTTPGYPTDMGGTARLARAAVLPRMIPDEGRVYLALRNIIKGNDARIRKAKSVQNFISKRQDQADIKHLIQQRTLEDLCQITQKLLRDGIFESTLQAELRFPKIFDASSNKEAKCSAPKKAIVKDKIVAIQALADRGQTKAKASVHTTTEDKIAANNVSAERVRGQTAAAITPNNITKETLAIQIPAQPCRAAAKTLVDTITNGEFDESINTYSLYSIYHPFEVQHRLLTKIQYILERSCYALAQVYLPDVLKERDWTCAEAVELNIWAKVFVQHQEKLDPASNSKLGKPLADLCNSIAEIRHTAVHRLRRPAKDTLQFIVDAESLANLFHDKATLDIIFKIRQHVQKYIEELECNKKILALRAVSDKSHFEEMRAELDRQEREALETTIKDDREYTELAGTRLKEALEAPVLITQDSDIGTKEESSDEAGGKEIQERKSTGICTLC